MYKAYVVSWICVGNYYKPCAVNAVECLLCSFLYITLNRRFIYVLDDAVKSRILTFCHQCIKDLPVHEMNVRNWLSPDGVAHCGHPHRIEQMLLEQFSVKYQNLVDCCNLSLLGGFWHSLNVNKPKKCIKLFFLWICFVVNISLIVELWSNKPAFSEMVI